MLLIAEAFYSGSLIYKGLLFILQRINRNFSIP